MTTWTKITKPTGTLWNKINKAANTSWLKIAKANISAGSSLIQSQKGYTGSSPLNIAYSSPTTVGNLLIVCASAAEATDVITISDTLGHNWIKSYNLTLGVVTASVFCAVSKGGTPTITLTASDIGGSVYEYLGLTTEVVASNGVGLGATVTPTATSLTITKPATIIAMAAQESQAVTFTACSGGFTLRQHNDAHVNAEADYLNASAGTYAAIFNTTPINTWKVLQVAFALSGTNWTNIPKA